MIALCTGNPVLDFDGGDSHRLILHVPSGDDVVQIAMTRHQARRMVEHGQRKLDANDFAEQANREAEIIALNKHIAQRRKRRQGPAG